MEKNPITRASNNEAAGSAPELTSMLNVFQIETSGAADRVFGIPELLEFILDELPFKYAHRIIRVNTTLRDTISLSPRLQRKLFYQQQLSNTSSQAIKPAINPVLYDMLYYISKQADLLSLEVVQPTSAIYDTYSDREKKINDMAREKGFQYLVWFNISKERTRRVEEMVKWMRSQSQLWHSMYVTDRPCAIIGGYDQFEGDYLFPPDIKMEPLIRRLVKRNRYRFRFHGPESEWRVRELCGMRKHAM